MASPSHGRLARFSRWLDGPLYLGEPQRQPTQDDVQSWMDAASTDQPPKMDRNWIIKKLKQKNIVRMRRLRKDFAWMKRQMSKFGLNPDDARWLL